MHRLAIILAVGLLLRLIKLPDLSIAYDGLQSLTHAARGFPVGAMSAFLHDPHPPLYYLLLGQWMHLGTSDAWVLLFSVLVSLLLVASVYRIALILDGERAALVAALVCALHPLALYWSHHARMYSLVMLLVVWAFYFNVQMLANGAHRWRDAGWMIAAELAVIYSHVAAPFFLAFVYLYALFWKPREPGALGRWLLAHLAVAVATIPYLFFPLTTGQSHMLQPDLADVGRALSIQTLGMEPAGGAAVFLGALVFLGVAALLVVKPGQRSFAWCFLLLPFIVAALASHGVRPIWHASRLFAFVTPFFALAVGTLAAEVGPGRRLGQAAAAAALVAISAGALFYTFGYAKDERFVDAARIVRERARPGDLVLVPGIKDKWAFNWYFAGPDWCRGAWTAGSLEALRRTLNGPERRAMLEKIAAFGRGLSGEPVAVLPASATDTSAVRDAPRVWVLAGNLRERDRLLTKFDVNGESERFEVRGLELLIFER